VTVDAERTDARQLAGVVVGSIAITIAVGALVFFGVDGLTSDEADVQELAASSSG
jgi:hypothetical protein